MKAEAGMFDPFRPDLLAGKTTIITGGGTGLGRSMALRFAGLGAKVAVLGRRPEPLAETAEAIRSAGGPARRFGEHWELTNLAAYLMSDASPYQTGDEVTLDGAEALFSGQQFAGLAHLPRPEAKALMASLRPKK